MFSTFSINTLGKIKPDERTSYFLVILKKGDQKLKIFTEYVFCYYNICILRYALFNKTLHIFIRSISKFNKIFTSIQSHERTASIPYWPDFFCSSSERGQKNEGLLVEKILATCLYIYNGLFIYKVVICL